MNLQEIVDALAPLTDRQATFDGEMMVIRLSVSQFEAVETVVAAMQLANLMNYKKAQDSFPRLLQAVKLVLAIADHPEQNPTEKISLAPKTRAQLDSALKFAEKS
jgi:hypothetical protein